MTYAFTPEQAVDRARDWIGDPGLNLELKHVVQYSHAPWLDFYKLSGDGHAVWVNCQGGWISLWSCSPGHVAFNSMLSQEGASQQPRLSQQEIIDHATSFLRARVAGWDSLNMVLGPDGLSGAGLEPVLYVQQARPGVLYSARYYSVDVNVFTGEVIGTMGKQGPPLSLPTQPSISEAQAVNQAFALIPTIHPDARSAYLHPMAADISVSLYVGVDGLKQQFLAYEVDLLWSREPDLSYEQCIQWGRQIQIRVDAHTGAYMSHDDYLGGGAARKGAESRGVHYSGKKVRHAGLPQAPEVHRDGRKLSLGVPPILKAGQAYWYVGYLNSPFWKGEVKRSGSALTLTVRGREALLRDGLRDARLDGKAIRLPAAPFRKRGRSYVPIELLTRLTGDRFTWKKDRLIIESADRGNFRSAGRGSG